MRIQYNVTCLNPSHIYMYIKKKNIHIQLALIYDNYIAGGVFTDLKLFDSENKDYYTGVFIRIKRLLKPVSGDCSLY